MDFELTGLHFNLNVNMKFGHGVASEVGGECLDRGWSRALVITDEGLLRSGIVDHVLHSLRESGIEYGIFDKVEPNPKNTTVALAAQQAKDFGAEVVIGVGGGSSLDTAKAAGLLVTNGGSIHDYDGVNKVTKQPLPIIAVPTTAGTGSEVTANAAISDLASKYKMSVRSPRIIPSLSFLDPSLLRSIPGFICATSSVDALTHAMEGFLSTRATTFTDLIAVQAIRIISANIRPFYANPAATNPASAMLYGSMLAGLVITNTGTGNAHALARALGGEFDVAHGHACAIFLPPVLRFNSIASPYKFIKMAESMNLVSERENISAGDAARLIVEEVNSLLDDLNIPKNLNSLNVGDGGSFDKVAEVALRNSGPNPRKSSLSDMVKLLQEAYSA